MSLSLGLIGHPVAQSLSPVLHKSALAYCGLSGEYCLIDIEPSELANRLSILIADGLNGFNVTIPHKQSLFSLVGALTNEARLVGAVNTVKVSHDGSLIGHNTDYPGLKAALLAGCQQDIAGKKSLILGAGGAALAAACALMSLNVGYIAILARDNAKQEAFIDAVLKQWHANDNGCESQTQLVSHHELSSLSELALVVNATSLGLKDDTEPLWMMDLFTSLNDECFCLDLVYRKNRQLPTFAKMAKVRGFKSEDGIEMLVHQAKIAFEYWSGRQVPYEIMKGALSRL